MKIIPTIKLKKTAPAIILFVYDAKLAEQVKALELPGNIKRTLVSSIELFKTTVGGSYVVSVANGKTHVIIIGLGKKANITEHVYVRALRAGFRVANELKLERVSLLPADIGIDQSRIARLVAIQSKLALYSFGKYKKEKKNTLLSCEIVYTKKIENRFEIKSAIDTGTIIGEAINNARDLSNTPGGDMTPTFLAEHAIQDGKKFGFSVKIFDEKKMKALKMGGILGVANGSHENPRFIICEYTGAKKINEKPLVFVGKGVTFDTGGLNLKQDDGMNEMHMDMSGGASVIHAISAIARLRLPVHVVGLIPAVENMPGSAGYRPGDILRAHNGKTIEVKNTDAEGRIILADALSYAKEYDPEIVLDLATLTGASVVALGQRTSAIMTNDSALELDLRKAGESAQDRVWPLPFWPEYTDDIKGEFADVANLGKTRYGGAMTAGAFLREFAPIKKWAHIDIAPTMTSISEDMLAKGSKGAGVHLLIVFTEQYVQARTKK